MACGVESMSRVPLGKAFDVNGPIGPWYGGYTTSRYDSGLALEDIDLFEVNEAFACIPLMWQREIGADPEKTNVNGGSVAIGHPVGSTGARLMTVLLNELERTGGRYGLQAVCEGGGMANATIIERLD